MADGLSRAGRPTFGAWIAEKKPRRATEHRGGRSDPGRIHRTPPVRRTSEHVLRPSGLTTAAVPWPPAWTTSGVIDVLGPLVADARSRRLRDVIGARLSSVTVLMDAPHDPHNGAAVMRSSDAFGVQEVHVVPRDE